MAISKFEILNYIFKSKDGASWNEVSEMLNECWTEERIIEFINWYLKVHKLSERYFLENKSLIESFEKGDTPQMWCDGTNVNSESAALPIFDVSNNEVYFCTEKPKRECRFRLGEKCTSIGDCPHKNTEVAVCDHSKYSYFRIINKTRKCNNCGEIYEAN